MRLIDDARICLIFFTRLPVPWPEDLPRERIVRAFQAAPFVGLVVGAIGALAYAAAFHLWGGSAYVSAAVAVAAQLLATGAFHEDGLADFLDGTGGRAPAERLEIMRDSRIGTFGAAGLFMALLLKVLLVAEVATPLQAGLVLIASGVAARVVLVHLMTWLGPAPDDGPPPGQPTRFEAGTATLIGAILVVAALFAAFGFSFGGPLMGMAAGAAGGALAVGLLARRLLGGQTGDVLGAAAVVAELFALACACALLPPLGG